MRDGEKWLSRTTSRTVTGPGPSTRGDASPDAPPDCVDRDHAERRDREHERDAHRSQPPAGCR